MEKKLKKYNNCFLAYLDVLGYKDEILKDTFNPEEMFGKWEDMIATIRMFRVLDEKEETKEKNEHVSWVYEKTDVYSYGDTLVITCPFEDKSINKYGEMINIRISVYFKIVTILAFFMIEKFGLIRGAITTGQYYERYVGNKFVTVSQALVEAHVLEKEAIYPRIVISEGVQEVLNRLKYFEIQGNSRREIFEDVDSEKFLNLYYLMYQADSKLFYTKTLKDVAEKIKYVLSLNPNRKILGKINWFKNYHNEAVKFYKEKEKIDSIENLYV